MLRAIMRRVYFARALRSRRFALLWSGQTISALGDGAFFTALAWQVLVLTRSGTAMGLALVAETVPIVLFMLIGGVVADRLPRRLTLLWSDGGRAVVTLVVAGLGIAGLLQFWHLLALAFLFGLAEAFFRPAYQSIPPELVPPDDLPSANALSSLSRNVSMLIGPALGATLVGLSSASLAFAFDGLTFIVSAVCLIMMGQVDKRPGPSVAPAVTPVGGGGDNIEAILAARARGRRANARRHDGGDRVSGAGAVCERATRRVSRHPRGHWLHHWLDLALADHRAGFAGQCRFGAAPGDAAQARA